MQGHSFRLWDELLHSTATHPTDAGAGNRDDDNPEAHAQASLPQTAAQEFRRKRFKTESDEGEPEQALKPKYQSHAAKRQAILAVEIEAVRHQVAEAMRESVSHTKAYKPLAMAEAYSRDCLRILLQAQATKTLHDSNNVQILPPIEQVRNLIALAFNSFHFPNTEWWVCNYAKLPPNLLLEIETMYFATVEQQLSLWSSGHASFRQHAEQRLAVLYEHRQLGAKLLAEHRPDVFMHLWKASFETTDARETSSRPLALFDPSSTHRLSVKSSGSHSFACLLDALDISPATREAMLPAWQLYKQRMAHLEQQIATAKQVLIKNNNYGGASSIQARSERFLVTAEIARFLKETPRHMMDIYGSLTAAICAELTPLQHARLLLGCRPHLPDYARMCQSLLRTN